jgi:hypothetical protein
MRYLAIGCVHVLSYPCFQVTAVSYYSSIMTSEFLGWSILGLNFSILIFLLLQGSESWVYRMAVLSNCLTFSFVAAALTFRDVIDEATESDEERAQRAEAEARSELNKGKLKALLEEYKQLHADVNEREEKYAIAEALFQIRDTCMRLMEDFDDTVLREQGKDASARLDHLQNRKSRRELRAQRIWLDIGRLKRVIGSLGRVVVLLRTGNFI